MAKIFVETYGCAMNQSDSETMKGILEKDGFKFTNSEKSANLILINSCIVKGPTLNKIIARVKKLQNENKKVVVAGCISQAEPDMIPNTSLLGTEELEQISDVVTETLEGNVVQMISRKKDKRLNLPKVRRNNVIEIVPISRGCLGSCSYCKVKFARGKLFSYDLKEIVKHVRTAVKEGAKEIWITSQDNGAYGQDIGTNIIELMKQVLAIKGDFKVRLGMINPNFVKKYLKGFIEILHHDKMLRFLHIPLQSGSDDVLKHMKRQYTVKDFVQVIQKLRDTFEDLTLATDIIVGYPTETEHDFLHTLVVLQETQIDMVNRSKFYSMPGTEASKLKQLDSKIIKKRSAELDEVRKFISKARNLDWVGWKGEILVNEKGKDNTFIGRNYAYKGIIIKSRVKIGDYIKVKVKSATIDDLRAERIKKQ